MKTSLEKIAFAYSLNRGIKRFLVGIVVIFAAMIVSVVFLLLLGISLVFLWLGKTAHKANKSTDIARKWITQLNEWGKQ